MIARKRLAHVLLLTISCCSAFPVTCHSIFAKRKPLPDEGEYEYVMMAGSQIPQRVKKGTAGTTISPIDRIGAEQARKAFDQNTKSPPPLK
jgi:hypothetical protein